MDVPAAAEFSGASILASPQGCDLLSILGVPAAKFNSISPGQAIDTGDFRVQVYETRHRKVFGSIPYYGPLKGNLKPPLRPGDYRMDMQYSFLISVNAIRVLVTSGINDEPAVPADVLLVGPDATYDQLARIVEGVMPRLILPNHWDDMFQSLDRPVRPMIVPPPELFSPLKRINLDQFQKNLVRIAPTAKVIIPEYFVPYALDIELGQPS
jgi:L-ascorbate metabolism protein UlaG (beta-lactamase superfamily)